MELDGADALEAEYDIEMERARQATASGAPSTGRRSGGDGKEVQVEMMPTLDGLGRLYDVGKGEAEEKVLPGNRKKKEKVGAIHRPSSPRAFN